MLQLQTCGYEGLRRYFTYKTVGVQVYSKLHNINNVYFPIYTKSVHNFEASFNKSSFSHYFLFNYYSINYLSWTLCFVNFFICTISYLVSLIFNIICSYFAYLLIQKWIHCHFSASARYISHATSIQVPTPLSDLSSFSTGRGKNF